MPAKRIHHVDLAVADVERSLAFFTDLLRPLGWTHSVRYPTYRGTEEVVYLEDPVSRCGLGIRPADGSTRYYGVGIEHFAFEVDEREEVDATHARAAWSAGTRSSSRRKKTATSRAITRSSSSTLTGSGSRCSAGRGRAASSRQQLVRRLSHHAPPYHPTCPDQALATAPAGRCAVRWGLSRGGGARRGPVRCGGEAGAA